MGIKKHDTMKEKKYAKETPIKRHHMTSMGKSIENVPGTLREYLYPKMSVIKPHLAQSESGEVQTDS